MKETVKIDKQIIKIHIKTVKKQKTDRKSAINCNYNYLIGKDDITPINQKNKKCAKTKTLYCRRLERRYTENDVKNLYSFEL